MTHKIAQIQQQQPFVAPNVTDVKDVDKDTQKEMYKKDLDFTMKQITMLQTKVQDLQRLVAQTIDQPSNEQFEQLDRLENEEQKDLDVQQNVSMSEQEMQQERLLQEQQLQQERQLQLQQQMTQPMIQPMFQMGKKATWVKSENANIKIAIKNTELFCDVAATPRQQASGLQAYDSLQENRGLWFPFNTRKSATFHMGEVKFPIDIIFIDNNKVAKIIAGVNPRQPGSWSNICTDVVEVNGGWCAKNKIGIGDSIVLPMSERIAQIYPGTKIPKGWETKNIDTNRDIEYYRYYNNEELANMVAYVRRDSNKISYGVTDIVTGDEVSAADPPITGFKKEFIIKDIKDTSKYMNQFLKEVDDKYKQLSLYYSKGKYKCTNCGRDADFGQPCWWCGNKVAGANSYDTLRTITTAEGNEEYTPEELEIIRVFPHLKSAQIYPGTKIPQGWIQEFSDPNKDVECYLTRIDDIDNILNIEDLFNKVNADYGNYLHHKDEYQFSVLVDRDGSSINVYYRISDWTDPSGNPYRFKIDNINGGHFDIKNIRDASKYMNKAFEFAKQYINNITSATTASPVTMACPTCGRDADFGQPCWWCGSKTAQEHRQPDTTDNRYDEHDRRNPDIRYKHNTTPDIESPQGDGDPAHVDPLSSELSSENYGKHFDVQYGYDPATFREEDNSVAIRPTAQLVTVQSPSPDTELAGLDMSKLASGSLSLYDTHTPEWHDYDHDEKYEGDPGYDKMAIINDQLISNWIDSLGFDPKDEAMLRKSMFTDEYKRLLGETLIASGQAINFELFDSDLLLYK